MPAEEGPQDLGGSIPLNVYCNPDLACEDDSRRRQSQIVDPYRHCEVVEVDNEFHNARPKELVYRRHGDCESPAERDNRIIVTLHQKRLDAVNTAVQVGDKMFLSFCSLRCRDDSYTVVFGIVSIERGSRQQSRHVDNASPAGFGECSLDKEDAAVGKVARYLANC